MNDLFSLQVTKHPTESCYSMVTICRSSLDRFRDWLIWLYNISAKSQGLSVLALCHPLNFGTGPQACPLKLTV